jgi:hypothetical protein
METLVFLSARKQAMHQLRSCCSILSPPTTKGAFVAVGGATIRIAHSTVTGNNLGWETTNGGVMQSYGDNSIDGNNTSENAPPGIAHK